MNERIDLTLAADTSAWDKAFSQAGAGAEKLGKAIGETKDTFEDLGKGLTTRMASVGGLLGKQADVWALIDKKVEGASKQTKSFVDRVADLGHKLAGVDKLMEWGKKAIELAKFSSEFQRMEAAVPVEKLRQLEAATQGTVSKFELLKQATKGMDLPLDGAILQVERAQAAWSNFIDDVKVGLGELVNQVGVAVARLLGLIPKSKQERLNAGSKAWAARTGASDLAYNTAEGLGEFGGLIPPGLQFISGNLLSPNRGGVAGAQARIDEQVRRAVAMGATAQSIGIEDTFQGTFDNALFAQQFAKGLGLGARKTSKKERRTPSPGAFDFLFRGPVGSMFNVPEEGAFDFLGRGDMDSRGMFGLPNRGMFEGLGGGLGKKKDDGFWGFNLDKLDEQEKALTDMQAKFGGAFDMFASSVGAAVDAAITGSDSIGKAFLKASAAALRALAVESSVRAAYNLAMGIGATAIGSPQAGAYFAAAGQFALTAALAGGGSALLGAVSGGGGGAKASPRTPAGGGAMPIGGTTERPGQSITVYVGDGFVGRPDELAVAIADKLNHGVQTGRVRTIVQTKPGAVTFRG